MVMPREGVHLISAESIDSSSLAGLQLLLYLISRKILALSLEEEISSLLFLLSTEKGGIQIDCRGGHCKRQLCKRRPT